MINHFIKIKKTDKEKKNLNKNKTMKITLNLKISNEKR